MIQDFPRGSEWRKWDLHFHTPSSYDYKDKSVTNMQIIETLKENNISVVAITDHHTIDIERILELQRLARDEITILPGIEFCSESRGKDPIHFIGIFHTECDLEYISNEIMSKTNINKQRKEGRKESEIYCKLEETCNLIKELGGVVSIHAGKKSNSIEVITNSLPVNMAQKRDIVKVIDIFELGKKSDLEDYKNIVFKSLNKNYPMIICSDNHDIKNYHLKENCWIKADPTFEGLKQIIYEPEERIRIQKNNPEFDFDKPVFSKIIVKSPIEIFKDEKVEFEKMKLPLNKNLVTLIGGRGSGKSLFLNYIANTFNKEIISYKNKSTEFNNSKDFIVSWQKNNVPKPDMIDFNSWEKKTLDFIFIEQGKLKNISNYKELSKEINKMLKIEDLQFNVHLDNEIADLLKEIKSLKEWFEYENEKGEKINDRMFNESKMNKAKELLETITTKENKEKLEKYTFNIKSINNGENILLELDSLKKNLEEYQKSTNEIIGNLNFKIINEGIKIINIPDIEFEEQFDIINKIKNRLDNQIKVKKKENDAIKKEFENQGYVGDLKTLLNNAEKYQREFQYAEEKLKEIEEKEKQLSKKIEERRHIGGKLKEEYCGQVEKINTAWKNILNYFSGEQQKIMEKILSERNISVNGKLYFDKNKFSEKLNKYIDKRIYKNPLIDLGILNLDKYWDFIENKLGNFIEGEEAKATKHNLEDLFFDIKERREYLYVISEIRYMNKTLEQLSIGQRGTLYLLLQLATNAFSSPLIFDQPEDDLDNEFITNELVELLKELKRYRQLIIATHNANLVVTADAEQIIIAKNDKEKLSYMSGSLENPEIIEEVCKILEGGKEAFEKRKNRYHFI